MSILTRRKPEATVKSLAFNQPEPCRICWKIQTDNDKYEATHRNACSVGRHMRLWTPATVRTDLMPGASRGARRA